MDNIYSNGPYYTLANYYNHHPMLYYLCSDHWTLPGPYLQKTVAMASGTSMHYCYESRKITI